MSIALGKEFSAAGTMTQDMQRKLLYLAMSGSGSVISAFSSVSGFGAHAKDNDEFSADLETFLIRQQQLREQERLQAINDRLDRLERESYEALIKTQEELKQAREDLDALRDSAYEITDLDGQQIKVYRDDNTVRTEDGNEVSKDLIQADDIADHFPNMQEIKGANNLIRTKLKQQDQLIDYRQNLEERRNQAQSKPKDKELDELEQAINDLPELSEIMHNSAKQDMKQNSIIHQTHQEFQNPQNLHTPQSQPNL